MFTKTYLFLLGLIAAFFSFEIAGHAATALDPATGNGPALQFFEVVYNAFTGGHYAYAACLALVAGVAIVRQTANIDFFHTDAGSAILILCGSFGTAMVSALVGGGAVSWTMVWTSIVVGFTSAGGYSALKALFIRPYVDKYAGRGPAWLHEPMKLILWIFQESGRASTPEEQAVKAVAAINKPSSDITVVVSTPEGTAVASSPAVPAPAPIRVVSETAEGVSVSRTMTPSGNTPAKSNV